MLIILNFAANICAAIVQDWSSVSATKNLKTDGSLRGRLMGSSRSPGDFAEDHGTIISPFCSLFFPMARV